MKTLIVGSNGFLGKCLASHFSSLTQGDWQVFCSVQSFSGQSPANGLELDLSAPLTHEFYSKLSKLRLQWGAICAAVTAIDDCKKNPEHSRAVNVTNTFKLLDFFHEDGIRPIFFSSESVFNGRKDRPDEESEPSPVSEYGKQKLEVEKYIRANFSDYLIIRMGRLLSITSHPRNAITDIAEKLKKGQLLQLPEDRRITPVFIEDIGPALAQLMVQNRTGIFHFATIQDYSWVELAQNVADVFCLDSSLISPITVEEMSTSHGVEKRGHYATLDSNRVRSQLGISFRELSDGLREWKN